MKNSKTEFSILLLTDIHDAEKTLKTLVQKFNQCPINQTI